MKKILISLLAGAALTAGAASSTVTIIPGGFVNVLPINNGNIKVTQFILTSSTGTNCAVSVYDGITNSTTFVTPAYTNTISYLTNIPVIYTNYFGVTTTNANSSGVNYTLVDATNAVAASTNSFPIRFAASALANTSFRADQVNYYFWTGCWATNTSTGTCQLTVTYQQ